MSMHDAVLEVFREQEHRDMALTSTDVNRIVTNVVRNFSLQKTANEQIEYELNTYISRYKRTSKRDCGCRKK